jgi:hypothetical protein
VPTEEGTKVRKVLVYMPEDEVFFPLVRMAKRELRPLSPQIVYLLRKALQAEQKGDGGGNHGLT